MIVNIKVNLICLISIGADEGKTMELIDSSKESKESGLLKKKIKDGQKIYELSSIEKRKLQDSITIIH